MTVTLHHAPRTRSTGALCPLEEPGVPHAPNLVHVQRGEGRRPECLSVNPLGQVPALTDAHGAVVTEQVAIFLHPAGAYPAAGRAPALGDALRGPSLRAMALYAAAFAPAVIERAMERGPPKPGMSHYGTHEATLAVVRGMLAPGPFVPGGRFSAAGILWATALEWTMAFGMVPKEPLFEEFVGRIVARPAMRRARRGDAELAAAARAP